MIPRLRLVSALFVFALLILFFVSIGLGFHRSISPFGEGKEPSSEIQDVHSEKVAPPLLTNACPDRLDWIRSLANSPDITFPLKYARRDIVVRPKQGLNSASILKHEEPLIPDFQQISDYNACELGEEQRLPPLYLDIPETSTHANASHILFGAATSLDRLNASIPFFQRWLADSGARLIIVVTGNDDATPDSDITAALQTQMRNLGMLVTLMKPIHRGDSNIERYFSLIKVLYENRDADTKWYGFIDDDTFFTSISRLVSRIGEYDNQKKLYLGAVSEEWWTVVHYGWIAMGGGGIFLSPPLVETLYANYRECRSNARTNFGDHRIAECVNRTTDVRLTQLDGLYQIDLHGDRSGVFESGRPILTLHHWKEGYWSEDGSGPDMIRHPRWFPIDKMSYISSLGGDTCFLQRFQFISSSTSPSNSPNTILTNGYSIAVYPKGSLQDLDLDKMEKTWAPQRKLEVESLNEGFDHYLGPLRRPQRLGVEKLHYRFMDGEILRGRDGKVEGVRQYYRRLGDKGKGELDELVELLWRMDEPGAGIQKGRNISTIASGMR